MRVLALVLGVLAVSACVTIGVRPPPTTSTTKPALQATHEPITPEPATPAPTPAPTTPPATPDPDVTPDPEATPLPTPLDLLPYLSSEITVVNLASQPLVLGVAIADADSGESFDVGRFEVQPEQVTSQGVVPARFRLTFKLGSNELATCAIDIADQEQLQFAVVETGVVITSNGPEPADPAEMVVSTASRCRAGEPT